MSIALGWGWNGSTYIGSPVGQPYETVLRLSECGDLPTPQISEEPA